MIILPFFRRKMRHDDKMCLEIRDATLIVGDFPNQQRKNRTMKKLSSFIFAALLSLGGLLHAGGFQLYSESATDMLGTAGSGVARGGRASAAWYNPATTVDIDRITVTGGGSLLGLSSEYSTSTASDDLVDKIRMTGFFYGVAPLGDDFRLNLSVNAPYGMITQWEPDSQLSSLSTYTCLRVCYISPSITWKVNDQLSFAAGPDIAIGVARLANYIDIPVPGQKRNKMYMSAESMGIGGFAAVYYKPSDEWGFGAKFQSRIHMRFDGDVKYRYREYLNGALKFHNSDAHASIDMPASVALGIRNNSFERWTFLFDAVWTKWSSYKALNLSFDKYPGTTTPGEVKNPRDWHDVWTYHAGAEYKLTDRWTLMAGFDYDNSPSNSRSTSPEMPDSDKFLIGVGVGYLADNWGFDIAYGYSRFTKTNLGSRVAAGKGIAERGTFKTDCHILSASVTLRF